MKKFLSIIFSMSLTTFVFAQSTTPEMKGEVLTLEKLATTYAKSLLNTYFDEDGVFHYTLPEDAETAPAIPKTEPEPLPAFINDSTTTDIVFGQAVHRNEFGIDGGIFWSPDKKKLAFYRMDQSMVGDYPLVQSDDRESTVKMVKYPMAGMTSHQVTLGVYDTVSEGTVYLKTNSKPVAEQVEKGLNDPEHYLPCVTWRPDGKQIYIAELNRLQNFLALNVYDVETGDYIETLFAEESEKYVEPLNPLYFLPGSNDKFVWQSQRDGFNHLYLYDLKKKTTTQLTSGNWLVTELVGADPKAKALYFMATKESPLENNLYCVDLKTKKISRLTSEAGRHSIKMSPDYTQFYDTYTNHDTPRICQRCKIQVSGLKFQVSREKLYEAKNPWEGYARPEVTVGTTKAADGVTDLYYRVVKPINMEEGKKYPAVVYLYNGPHLQLVTEGFQWGLPAWDCYMASHGYVVFTIDGRGSSNRGLDFEQAIWHNLGYNEGKDQMCGVEVLKSLPYVDADRIGIYGWSYGGFMTTYMMLNYPETFKVGVCGGPVLDWSRYEVMYGERYMGTPDNNPEGYAANTLINQAGKLKGKLLIIHDDQDDTVVPQMSYQFLKNSVKEGTYPDFMLYINHPHNVRGKDRNHLNQRIAQYFFDHL